MIQLVSPSAGQSALRLGLWGTARFSFTALACFSSFRGRYHRRRGVRDVFPWHELSRGTRRFLFLIEVCLTCHCACLLRLAESWFLFIFFPSAARDHLLSPPSFSRLHTLCGRAFSSFSTRCVWAFVALASELFPPPQAACGWDVVVLRSVCLPSCARHWRCNSAGTTHLVRLVFKGVKPTSARSSYALSTHLDLHVEAVMPWWHFRRRLDSSQASSRGLPLCLLSLSSRCSAGLPADLDAVLVLAGSGGACCPSWAVSPSSGLLHEDPNASSASIEVLLTLSSRVTPSSVKWLCSV